MTRRAGLTWLLLLAAIGLGVLAKTCGEQPGSGPAESSPVKNLADDPAADEPARRSARQHAPRAQAREANPAGDGSSTAVTSTAAPPGPDAAVARATVTRGGVPAANVDVWLLPVVAPELQPDSFAHSAGAYFGIPRYLRLWKEHAAVSGSDGLQATADHVRAKTDERGSAQLHLRPDTAYTVAVTAGIDRLVVTPRPAVRAAAGTAQELAVELSEPRRIRGRCVDSAGDPVADAWVQAFENGAERPASRLVETESAGSFALDLPGDAPTFRVRAVLNRSGPRFVLVDPETAPPPIPGDTTVLDVSPGPGEIVIRMAPAPVVLLEVNGDIPVNHLQLEGLVWDDYAAAWGRLGGPAYQGFVARTDSRHSLIAIPQADAERPFCVWSWSGPMLSAVDLRGRDRAAVTLHRGRKVVVRGRGWLAGDLVRVICHTGSPAGAMPVIWTEENPSSPGEWTRNDVPPCEVEFRILRGTRQVGAPARVPAGSEAVGEVRLDI